MSRAELMFEREAALRLAALDVADWERAIPSANGGDRKTVDARNAARKKLRQAALNFADLVRECDGGG